MDKITLFQCQQCHNQYPLQQFTMCPVCHIPLSPPEHHVQNPSIQGDNNRLNLTQVTGGNNDIKQANRDIIINPPPPEPEKTLIYRASIKPLTIAHTPVKTWWFFLSGGISFIGGLARIVGTWLTLTSGVANGTPSHGSIFLLPLSILLLASGGLLHYGRYRTLLFGRTIETDKKGRLYLTRIKGTCSICKHPVSIRTIGPNNHRVTVVSCDNNPSQHRWAFDRTVLPDVGEDYEQGQDQY